MTDSQKKMLSLLGKTEADTQPKTASASDSSDLEERVATCEEALNILLGVSE